MKKDWCRQIVKRMSYSKISILIFILNIAIFFRFRKESQKQTFYFNAFTTTFIK